VSTLEVPLESIRPAFQGVIPSPIATASLDGSPNSAYLSIVWYVDEERIAISNQFFSKTAANLRENRFITLRLIDPSTMFEYELDATHLRSESNGEVFEAVRAQLEAVAAQSGMEAVFHLRSVEILRVDRCASVKAPVAAANPVGQPAALLASLDTFVRRLAECRDLAEATRVGLHAIEDLFGFRHSMLLVADAAEAKLFAIATNGYRSGGVGAEVPINEGAIGVAAHRRRQVRLANVERMALGGATSGHRESNEIPLPGLDDAQSVLATPLLLHDRLIGVLYLDSAEPRSFDADAGRLLEILAGHFAVTIALLEAGGLEPLMTEPDPAITVGPASTFGVVFHEHDGSVFVDGDYVIRGVPGRILFSLLREHGESGRTEFTNREIRLDRTVRLPAGNDNLEARLLTLRRRLAEREDPFRLDRVGRGRLRLTVEGSLALTRRDL